MKKITKIFSTSLLSFAVLTALVSFIPQDNSSEVAAILPDPPRMFSTGNEVAAILPDPPRMFSTGDEVAAILPDPPRMFAADKTV